MVGERPREADPNDPRLQKQAGDRLARAGKHQQALARYQRAVELAPKFQAAYTAGVALAWRTKTYGPLPGLYLSALRAGVRLPDPYRGLGQAYYHLGENRKGVEALRRHLREHPELAKPEGILRMIAAMRERMRRGMPRGRAASTIQADWLKDMGDGR